MDLSKLTDAAEAMRKFVATAAGKDEEEQQPKGAVPGNAAAAQLARDARQSYQKTARWMLAAFAAVGVLIFGSLPFAAIADVELTWPTSLWLVGGLVVAVAGIVTAVISVSLVNEPEDVSLGELDCELRAIQKTDDKGFLWVKGHPVLTVNKLRAKWNPRLASRIEFVNILHGPDSSAHLGPNLAADERPASVTNLIQKLGDLESQHANLAPLVARQTVSTESYEKRVDRLAELLEELRKRQAEHPDANLNNEIGAASAMYAAAATKLDSEQAALTTEKQKLAAIDDQLKLYHDHRDLVLAESGVMQLRGTFRLARRVLAIAAVLTLFGGTAYALSLPGATANAEQPAAAPQPTTPTPAPPAYSTGLPATVVVHEGTRAAEELPAECVDRELPAIWVGTDRVPATTGPFTVTVTDQSCTGEITVTKGEGRFALTP
jgi:phage host-nuclease inhibitor protein Gam